MRDIMIIGIAGGTGSGKTTLARNIAESFGERISVIKHDDYYKEHSELNYAERCKLNYDHPDAFDTPLLLSHLDALKRGETVDCPIYDYKIHNRSGKTKRIYPNPVILLDGILIFESNEILSRLDLKIFVDTDADVRIVRRIMRDVKRRGRTLESVVNQYLSTVKPMHDAFVEPSKKRADIIIPEGGRNPAAYGMIIDRIEKQLTKNKNSEEE
jgi:uridine kinase